MKSMTGFAQGRFEFNSISLNVVMRSWNHRFLEMNFKGAGITADTEKLLKEIIKDRIIRGKVEIVFDLFLADQSRYKIQLNSRLLTDVLDELLYFKQKYKEKISLSMDAILKIPMIFRLDYVSDHFDDTDLLTIRESVNKVLNDFTASREVEGNAIARDVLDGINKIETNLALLKKETEKVEKEIFVRYKEKIARFLTDIEPDERRIVQEAAILAEKSCINEELQRLDTHNRRLKAIILDEKMEAIGREADFLTQEMFRETHTIASKTGSMEIHEKILEIRREIEKIKQQVQNVE